jgi:hypothetical protein
MRLPIDPPIRRAHPAGPENAEGRWARSAASHQRRPGDEEDTRGRADRRAKCDLVRTYDLGANAYVVKPVSFEDFIGVQALGQFWGTISEGAPQQK